MTYHDHFPRLSEVTAGLKHELIAAISPNISLYPVDVQQEYAAYVEYMKEYEAWSDSLSTPNFLQDY